MLWRKSAWMYCTSVHWKKVTASFSLTPHYILLDSNSAEPNISAWFVCMLLGYFLAGWWNSPQTFFLKFSAALPIHVFLHVIFPNYSFSVHAPVKTDVFCEVCNIGNVLINDVIALISYDTWIMWCRVRIVTQHYASKLFHILQLICSLSRNNHGRCSTLFCAVVCRSIEIIETTIPDTGKEYVFKYSNWYE